MFHPDLVILDINMPVMNGYEAASAIRKELTPGSALVLVALTSGARHADLERAREAGFDHHLSKPLVADFCRLTASYLAEAARKTANHGGR